MKNYSNILLLLSAMRYEVAAEPCKLLIAETKGAAELCAIQAMFPLATPYGMAALLPHREITLDENLKVLCDGMAAESTAARERVLKTVCGGNAAVSYKEMLARIGNLYRVKFLRA